MLYHESTRRTHMADDQPNSRKKWGIAYVLAFVVLAVVAGVAVYALRENENQQTDNNNTATSANQSEQTTKETEENEAITRTGTFIGVPPKTGSGSVSVTTDASGKTTVKLNDDFMVQEGPDLYVSFGDDNTVDHDTLFAELKSFTGSQEYTVPDSIDVGKYGQVIIYCKEFSVVFSAATLQ